jgi:hypothetical protein
VLAVIEHASRRIRILGATAQSTAPWGTGCRARYLIRDGDGKFPGMFDAILADAGIETVLSGVRMPSSRCPSRWQLLTRSPALTYNDATGSVECFMSITVRHELHG